MMQRRPSVIIFDVNETLSDMSPLAQRFVDVGAPGAMFPTWFAGVLRDGFALTMTGTPKPFVEVASGVLAQALAPVELDRPMTEAIEHVIAGFGTLDVHPDVVDGVKALAAAGFRLVTLTNGSVDISSGLLERAGIRDRFEATLSVETGGPWKPAASAYAYALETCKITVDQAALVAVHPWDVHGAIRAGLTGVWLNRDDRSYPDRFTSPSLTVTALPELADAWSH